MKGLVFFLGLVVLVVALAWQALESAPKSQIVETYDLPLAAPQVDIATRNALEAAWARVKSSSFDTYATGLSEEEFAERDFPMQTMMLRKGDLGAGVKALYIGAEELGEDGVPSQVFSYEKGFSRVWWDTRYSVDDVQVSADGGQIIVQSGPTIEGSSWWFAGCTVIALVSFVVGLLLYGGLILLIAFIPGWLASVWYRVRS